MYSHHFKILPQNRLDFTKNDAYKSYNRLKAILIVKNLVKNLKLLLLSTLREEIWDLENTILKFKKTNIEIWNFSFINQNSSYYIFVNSFG